MDAQGRCFEAQNVEAGAQATLRPFGGATPRRILATPRRWYADACWDDFRERNKGEAPIQDLRPGSYVAFLQGSPFLENGLGHRAHLRQESVVLGILKAVREDLP